MNKVILMGRLTKDPDVRYTTGNNSTAVARYTLAVERRFKQDGGPDADFIPCVAFGRNGEFAEKYFKKGMRITVVGHIQTGSYTNKDGNKVYTTDVFAEEQGFVDSKNSADNTPANNASNNGNSNYTAAGSAPANDGFTPVTEEDLPWR